MSFIYNCTKISENQIILQSANLKHLIWNDPIIISNYQNLTKSIKIRKNKETQMKLLLKFRIT